MRLKDEISASVRAAGAADTAEDMRLGREVRGDEWPEELRRREDRLAAIRAAKVWSEAKQRAGDDARERQPVQDRNPKGGAPVKARACGEPDEKARSNFTDPESGIMKTRSEGFQQCYNVQVAVDGEHQLVVATEVTANASDQGGVPMLLEVVKETFNAQPKAVLADAGRRRQADGRPDAFGAQTGLMVRRRRASRARPCSVRKPGARRSPVVRTSSNWRSVCEAHDPTGERPVREIRTPGSVDFVECHLTRPMLRSGLCGEGLGPSRRA